MRLKGVGCKNGTIIKLGCQIAYVLAKKNLFLRKLALLTPQKPNFKFKTTYETSIDTKTMSKLN